MAGYSKLYVIGAAHGLDESIPRGLREVHGPNPIEMLILVGDGSRQWLEPHYFDPSIRPIGRVRAIVPAGPDDPNSLLDACIAFCPRYFESCPSLSEVASALRDTEHLDFHLNPEHIPEAWTRLRWEAAPLLSTMSIWKADLSLVKVDNGPSIRH